MLYGVTNPFIKKFINIKNTERAKCYAQEIGATLDLLHI